MPLFNPSSPLLPFLAVLLFVSGCHQKEDTSQAQSPIKRQPNILIIYLDDLGYGDMGAYGATELQTPNMDKLARGGIKFTNGYSSSDTCSHSRFSLLTGI
jgi:membrane-anchored protein YejM (alkaline phosphatase superfamily)